MKITNCSGTNYNGDLSECVNDANTMERRFKSREFNVLKYLESDVLKSRFKPELIKLRDYSISGEFTGIGLTHSGHGTTGRDAQGVLHEGLYFLDGVMWDYEFEEILQGIPEGFPFFIFFDTCFSAGMLRLVGTSAKARYIETDEIPEVRGVKRGMKDVISVNAIYFAACSKGEYSYDAPALGNGAATYYVDKYFPDAKGKSFEDWMNQVKTQLPTTQYPQTPELICKDELKLKNAFLWFEGTPTGLPDIPNEEPDPIPIKLNWWKRFIRWIKNLIQKL